MRNTRWVDFSSYQFWHPGDIGFLSEATELQEGKVFYLLKKVPSRTNMSNQPLLYGWCGTHHGCSLYAYGVAKVLRVAKDIRHRALVRVLHGEELKAALEELGYPELYAQELDREERKKYRTYYW